MIASGQSPRLGLTSWRLPVAIQNAPEFAAAAGASLLQIDFGGGTRGPELRPGPSCHELRERAQDAEIALAALAVNSLNDIGLTSSDSDDRSACQGLFGRAVQAAVALDIGLLIVPSFRKSFIRDDDDLASTEAFLGAACAIAAESNVNVATENVLDPGRLSAALSRLAAPNLRVVADLGNLAEYDIDPLEFARAADDRLHPDIHVKDLRVGPAGDCRLGAGVIDLASSVAEFRRLFPTMGFVVETDHRRSSPDQVGADMAWLTTVLADAEKEHT